MLNRYRATYDWAGNTISHKLRYRFPQGKSILDVGAGWGKYRDLFPDYIMHACEVWWPYVVEEMLDARYQKVFLQDICDLAASGELEYYDAMIFGDVFEHIERPRAKQLLKDIWDKCEEAYIVVPYMYEQGEVDGNPFEAHQQDDLTKDLMKREYPQLKLVDSDGAKGLYILNR